MANQTVIGPYRVKPLGERFEIVSMVDNSSHSYEELNPRRTYNKRQSAYRSCRSLNAQWQNDHLFENDLLEYWKEATN